MNRNPDPRTHRTPNEPPRTPGGAAVYLALPALLVAGLAPMVVVAALVGLVAGVALTVALQRRTRGRDPAAGGVDPATPTH
jgi:hypothetical protein